MTIIEAAGQATRSGINRRALIAAGAAGAIVATTGRAAASGWKPTRNVRLVVPFAAGGANDIIARVLGARLSEMWGHQVYIENKPGAGSNIGSADVARSPTDGHTLLITSSAIAVNRFLYDTLPFDPAELAPVSLVADIPNVMVVPAKAPSKTVADFIAEAKTRPGAMFFGSAGSGSSLHLIGELFRKQAGIDIKHVPYRGAAPAMNDLIGGRIDVMFDTATVSMPQLRGGTIRALGISTKERLSNLPDVPPIADTVAGFDVGSWFALFYPARTPPEIVQSVAGDVRTALHHPDAQARLQDLGARVAGSTPQELATLVKAEVERWGPLIKEAGIRGDN